MKKLILVVDDSLSARLFVTNVLIQNSFDVVEASNGREALAILSASKKRISLVISDFNMPQMDGPELAENIRKLPDYRFVKILMATSENDGSKKDTAKKSGVTAWMAKPFKSEAIIKAVQQFTC